MELLEYARLRWKPLAALFVIGLVLIVALAVRDLTGPKQATAELIVRPPEDAALAYSSNPDRYINTQLTLLSDPRVLDAPAQRLGIDSKRLGELLSAAHGSGTDIVSLTVRSSSERAAVRAVNAVADAYVTYLWTSRASANGERRAQLVAQSVRITKQLSKVGSQLQRALAIYIADNPGISNPSPSLVAPELAASQTVLNSRLSEVTQLQARLDAEASSVNPSRVVRPATEAAPTQRWDPVVFAAALLGLMLVVVVAAAFGLTASRRLIGASRFDWAEAGLAQPVRLSRNGAPRYDAVVRQLTYITMTRPPDTAPVTVTFLPAESARTGTHVTPLIERIRAETGRVCRIAVSLADSTALDGRAPETPPLDRPAPGAGPGQGSAGAASAPTAQRTPASLAATSPSLVILLIDRHECQFEDLERLAGLGTRTLAGIVPVLV